MSAGVRMVARGVAVVTSLVLAAGLVAIAAAPTGSPTLAASVPANTRLAATTAVGSVRVLLLESVTDSLAVQLDYRGAKGWLAVRPPGVPLGTTAAETSTTGGGPLPALSVAYGRSAGARVLVEWADGRRAGVPIGGAGLWIVARPGASPVLRITILDARGRPALQVVNP